MPDFASLTIQVNSSGTKEAAADLAKLSTAARKAEQDIVTATVKIESSLRKLQTGSFISGSVNNIIKQWAELHRMMSSVPSTALGKDFTKELNQIKSVIRDMPKELNKFLVELDTGMKKGTMNLGEVGHALENMRVAANKATFAVSGLMKSSSLSGVAGEVYGSNYLIKSLEGIEDFRNQMQQLRESAKQYEIAVENIRNVKGYDYDVFAEKYTKERQEALERVRRYRAVEDIREAELDKAAYSKVTQEPILAQLTKWEEKMKKINEQKEQTVKTKDRIVSKNKEITSSVFDWVKGVAKGLGIYLTLYGVGLLIRKSIEMWVGLIGEMITEIDELRMQIISSAAMMTSLTEKATPPKEAYDAWTDYFEWLYRASLAADRKVASSGKEIFKVAQEMAYRGVVATTTEQVDTIARLTDTIKMVTRGIGHQEWQIYQEIRNLFLGSEARLMGAQLLQRLKQIDPLVQQNIARLQKLRQETGDLAPMFAYIGELVKGMTVASEDFASTWEAFINTSRGAIQLLFYEGFGNGYKEIVKLGWQLLDIIYKNGQLTASGKVLGHVLSRAWENVSDIFKGFIKDVEQSPEKIGILAQTVIDAITNITRAALILTKALVAIAEAINYISDNLDLVQISLSTGVFGSLLALIAGVTPLGALAIGGGTALGFFTGTKAISNKINPEDRKRTQQTIREQIEEYQKIIAGELGNYKGKIPEFAGLIDIKEDEIQSILRKYTDMYLDFARTATRADESIWSKVINYQSQSLQRIKELGYEMRANNVLGEYAVKYEEKLLTMRKEATKALIEGVKLDYREYLAGLMEPLQEAKEKLKIEEEKAKRKWEIPPEIKAMDAYTQLMSNTMNRSAMITARTITDGCVKGGEFLINASLEMVRNITEGIKAASRSLFESKPITGGLETGTGGYIDYHYSQNIARPQFQPRNIRDFEVLANAINNLETGLEKAVSCGDAVAFAINKTLEARGGETFLPRGSGIGPGDLKKIAEAYSVPIYDRVQLTVDVLRKLGIGTIIYMKRQPGDYNYEYGKDHAEMVGMRPGTSELAIASYTKGKGLKWKDLTEEYIKNLPKQAMAVNPFLSMSYYGTPLPRLDEARIEQEKMMKQLEEERQQIIKEYQGMRRPDIEEKGWAQKWIDLGAIKDEKRLNIMREISSLEAELKANTVEEYDIKKGMLEIENQIAAVQFLKREFSDSEFQTLYKILRLKQEDLTKRRIELLDREKEIKKIDEQLTILSSNSETFSKLSNINKDYLSSTDAILVNTFKRNNLEAEHLIQRNNLNKLLIQNKDWLTQEQIAILQNNQALKEGVDLYNEFIESRKTELSYGGVGSGLELWALERMPEMQTRTTSFVKDVMKELESGMGDAIFSAIKNKGSEGLRQLGEQIINNIMQKMINLAVQSLFDIIANLIGKTSSPVAGAAQAAAVLIAAGSQCGSAIAAGGAAAAAQIRAAIGASTTTGQSGGGFFSWIGGLLGIGGLGGASSAGSYVGSSGVPAIDAAIGGLSYKIPMFASGGIVTKPTFAITGESGPEAIIPLQGGGVPVNINGEQREHQTTIINVIDPSLIGRVAAEFMSSKAGKTIIVNAINQEIYERGTTSRVIRGR